METNQRILIIDDNELVHQDINKVLQGDDSFGALDELAADILGKASGNGTATCCGYLIDSAFQGEEGVRMVEQAVADGKPYAMAFVDVRIPPGIDGIETVTHLREVDPDIAVVIITAYSDYNWEQIVAKIDNLDNLFILKKPFDGIEVRQFACALTEKWNMAQSLQSTMAAISRKEENLRNILESMEDGVYICDKQYTIQYANPVVQKEFGPHEGKKCYAYFHDQQEPCHWCRSEEVLAGKSARRELFFEKNQKIYDLNDTVLTEADGSVAKLQIMRDITERKKREEEALEKTILLQTIIDSSPAYIFIKDTENNFLLGNKSFAASLNLSPQELQGKSASQLFSKELADKYFQDDLGVIASGKPKTDIFEKGLTSGQGGVFSTSKVPLHNGNGEIVGVIGIATDISKLKKMEKELLKAKKFEVASVFAGGVCHDFNNLLAVIVGYTDLALHEVDKTSPVYSMLQKIIGSSLRFKELIHSFLSLSNTSIPGKGIFPLDKIIKNSVSIAVDRNEVHCEYLFADNLWQVAMDPSQVGQVLSNVVKNAEESLPEGGLIRITTDNIDSPTAARETHTSMEKEKYVRVIVEDYGVGIAEKNLSRIFDPYFSTKKRGTIKGMGLGLTIAYSVILKHEGHIHVESKLGEGTSVIIYLPAE